jgi:hypothetical protein
MNIQERVQEVFNRFNVKLTVSEQKGTELAEAALENGTVIYTDAEAFAEGAEAYIINDEGESIPLPPGDYPLADGGTIVVGEGGVITSVGEAEEVVEEVQEVEASEETTEELEVEVEAEDEPQYMTKAEVEEMIAAALESMNKDKEEMSAVNPEAPKAEKVEEVKEEKEDEAAVELAAVKAELEAIKKQAADAGLKHQAPTQKREPINLKNLSTQERVSALLQNFSK